MKIIDLSLPLENDRSWAPWWAVNKVKHQDHHFGKWIVRLLFGLKPRHLRTGLGWANDKISLSTHGTTHVDAPWHYSPLCAGQPARTIDQMPLDWFHGRGVVLDMRHLDAGGAASVDDLTKAASASQTILQPGHIVLIYTGNDSLWGKREYFSAGPGVSAEATHWLIDQGVRLMGIDAWGWDAPLAVQAQQARQEDRNDIFWAAHYVGVEKEYCQIERLANLGQLPAGGFTVCAFPLKVRGGSAGPARVVAILDNSDS